MSGFRDPFDATGSEGVGQDGGMPPQFYNNLLAFGAATMQGANARTPQGFLANGSGPLGPLGVGLQAGIANAQQGAKTRSELGLQRAQSANLGAEAGLHGAQVEQMRQAMKLFDSYVNSGAVPSLASGAPGTPPAQTASADPAAGGDDFVRKLYQAESSLTPGKVNNQGYAGLGQFGASRLATLGVYNPGASEDLKANQWKGSFNIPGYADVKNLQDFLHNPDAQHAVMNLHLADIDQNIAGTPGADRFDQNGLRAVAHLGGTQGMQNFVSSGGQYNPADSNGTKLSDYYKRFSGGAPPATGRAQAAAAPGQSGFAPLTGPTPPYQVAQAGNGPLPGPPAQPQAPIQMAPNMMPTQQPWNAGMQLGNQAAIMSLNPYMKGFATPLEAQSTALLGLATAGPTAAARAMNSNIDLRPGGMAYIQTPNGPQWIKNPEHIATVDPNTGLGSVSYISPPLPNAPPGTLGTSEPVKGPNGSSVVTSLGPAQTEWMKLAPDVTKDAIKEDNEKVQHLSQVPQDAHNAQLSLLQMRPQIDAAAPGAQGELRNSIKNFVQTWTPGIASALDLNATPGQILNKLTTLSAGKMESEDQGKRGGIGLLQTYMKANPGLELQPEANHDLTNALLVTNQYRADHAQGAIQFQNGQFRSVQRGGDYRKLTDYDSAFSQVFTPHPYMGAIDALNGKPDWNKGLTAQQQRLAAGVIQRADPQAQIPYQGHIVPISQWKNVISPTDENVLPLAGTQKP